MRRKFDRILAVEKGGKERKRLKFSLLTFFFEKVKESRKTPPSEAQRKAGSRGKGGARKRMEFSAKPETE